MPIAHKQSKVDDTANPPARDGNRSGRPAGRVAGQVEILRPAGQTG